MNNLLIILSFLVSVVSAQSYGKEVTYNIDFQRGVEYFDIRSKGAQGSFAPTENIDKAIYHFKMAMDQPGYELKSGIYLLRCYDFKGSFTNISDTKKIELFEEGMELGEKLKEKYPNNAGLLYWYMSNVGRWGQSVNFWKAVRANVAGSMRTLCVKILELDPAYNDAGAYRILGVLNIKIPHVPLFITWPSDEAGLEMLKKATELGPESVGNWVFYAEALSNMGQKEKAISILNKVITSAPRQHKLVEDRKIQERAKELLQEINGDKF